MAKSPEGRIRQTARWVLSDQRAVPTILFMLLSIDALLALIHVVVMIGWDAPNILRIDMDGSYGEAYQYAKFVWALLLLAFYALRERNWPVAAWLPLLLYLLLDDALLLHEQAGYWYSRQSWAFGFGPVSSQNVGELGISAAMGLVLVALVTVAYLRADRATRWVFRVFVALTVTLLVFAVAVDLVHGFFVDVRALDRGLGFVEDAGEMLVLSLIVTFCFWLVVHRGPVDPHAPRQTRSTEVQPRSRREVRGGR